MKYEMGRSGLDLGHACKTVDKKRGKVTRNKRCTCKVQLGESRKRDKMTIAAEKIHYTGRNSSYGDRFILKVACLY